MANQGQDTRLEAVMELLAGEGLGSLGEALRRLLNSAMQLERERHLGAGAYERSPGRRGHANGYKPKTVQTRVGELSLAVPQVREGGFYPRSLDKGLRSERALKLALAEMSGQGVSTRKVRRVTEQLCGFEVTATQVSRAATELDQVLERWRCRPLGLTPHLWLDARYEKVRQGGVVLDAAVLIAIGTDAEGRRQVLGVSVALSEAELHWRTFLEGLQQRGLTGVELIISDDHSGLRAARRAVWPSVPWQRCQYHLQVNASAYVPRAELRGVVAGELRVIFTAPDRAMADELLARLVQRYEREAPRLAQWLGRNVPEGLTVLSFPASHRPRLRTTNVLGRVNRELKRRTRVATLFPNEASCLRLVSALLMEIGEEWQVSPRYFTSPRPDEPYRRR
jgi:transposase-like protein